MSHSWETCKCDLKSSWWLPLYFLYWGTYKSECLNLLRLEELPKKIWISLLFHYSSSSIAVDLNSMCVLYWGTYVRVVKLFINDQNFYGYEFHYNTSTTTVIFLAVFDTANMHVECVAGIYHCILLYYWFQWHTHSTPCSFAISFVKYSLLSVFQLFIHTHVIWRNNKLFIIISYLGSELKETALSYYATAHHKSFTVTYCIYIHNFNLILLICKSASWVLICLIILFRFVWMMLSVVVVMRSVDSMSTFCCMAICIS